MASVFSLSDAFRTAEAVKGSRQQRKLRQAQMDALGAEQERAGNIASLSQAALGGQEGAFDQLAALDPQRATQLREFQQSGQPDMDAIRERVDLLDRIAETGLRVPQESRQQYLMGQLDRLPPGPYVNAAKEAVQRGEIDDASLTRFREQELAPIRFTIEEFSASPVTGIGPDGQPAFFQVGDRGTARPISGVTPAPKSGQVVEVTGPDGQTIRVGGGSDLAELSAPTRRSMEGEMVSFSDTLSDLNRLEEQFRPEFLEYSGAIQAGVSGLKDKAGLDLDPDEREQLTGYTNLVANTNRTLSTVIKQLSGAAVNASEEARLRSFIPNPDDGPTQYQAKLEQFKEATTKAYMRRAYMLRNNMLPDNPSGEAFDAVPLDEVPRLYNRRFDRALRQVTTANPQMPSDEARVMAHQIAGQEFGL